MADISRPSGTSYRRGWTSAKTALGGALYDPKNQGTDLLDVPGQALENLGPSALRAAEGVVQPIVHPIETAEGVYGLGRGLLGKMGAVSSSGYEKYPDVLGEFGKKFVTVLMKTSRRLWLLIQWGSCLIYPLLPLAAKVC